MRPTWGDTIAVEGFLIGQLLSFRLGLFPYFFRIPRCTKTATALLVLLCPRGHTVDGHKEEFLRLDFAKEVVDIGKYGSEYLLLGESKVRILVVWMRA